MNERRWWKFWTWFYRGPELQVRAFRSDGSEIDLTKTIAQRRAAERAAGDE